MRAYSLTHLGDSALLDRLATLVSQERDATAAVLAHLAEVEERRLYLPAGYPSMYEYCVTELRWSEQMAKKRLRAARVARRFPAIFDAVVSGRLHLTAVIMLGPRLTPENAGELIAAASNQTMAEIDRLLAEWFPRPDLPARLEAIASPPTPDEVSARTPDLLAQRSSGTADVPKVAPLSPQRFALQVTIDQSTYDMLQHAKELLSYQIPTGDLSAVLRRALEALISQLEKRKFGATDRPRPSRHASANARHVPAHVRRAVWERDGGRCTFVGDHGHRCGSRKFLEFDHIEPVALGGEATVEGIRLRCRAHNLLEADRILGAGFMSEKREEARRAAAVTRERVEAAGARARAEEQIQDVMTGLRSLGFRAQEARQAAEFGASLPEVPLEERVRAALKYLCPKRATGVMA